MVYNDISWWLLQVQFEEHFPGQKELFSQPMPRDILFRKAIDIIPANIRTTRGKNVWGLADLSNRGRDTIVCSLTVHPPVTHIAEEPEPGVLLPTEDPRYYTTIVIHIPKQIIAVNRSSEIGRYARSASSISSIIYDLLYDALNRLKMLQHYNLDISPISKTGSFVKWFESLEKLDSIKFHYLGPNLATEAGSLVDSIRNTANQYRRALKSETVDMIANEPHLDLAEVEELDEAAADKKIRMRARGTRSGGIKTTWSSSQNAVPDIVRAEIPDTDVAEREELISNKMVNYLIDYSDGR